ncbi:LLM class flavin-dependent oxidoreductase [Serinibacter salmoneus]|uniref:Luciferase-like monooxygenase n=1 Tax=Serinibacter salmoneus TaxID=556530 RepID=A0A2A9CZJ0_9MICO|nr:luciferase-like monooxygenase [Serinibacter salmoneus]
MHMDYGRDLTFGAFLTPSNADPEAVVDRAVVAEEVGLDLVTFQDHPYQPSFLDTWTLLSWVAARTSTIRLSGNVLNLPLRPPAVLARAVASLDLLSGGRVELGLGAGAFWDGIAGMGVERLTPGQGVTALEEGIDIIRGLWDTSSRERLVAGGEYHRVEGARRGPAPAHPVEIWLGALKPRMLRLVGRKADGWLPSMAYLKDPMAELAAGNDTIDTAARAAGRDPAAVRRMLNIGGRFAQQGTGVFDGPPEAWADEVVRLATQRGVDTFILATDDVAQLAAFGQQVAPLAREQVAAARAVHS